MALREIKVRLPGTTNPVSFYSQDEVTAGEIVDVAVEKFQLTDPSERRIVVSPTYTQPGGSVELDEYIQLADDLVIELWKEPYLVNVVSDVPSHHPSGLPPASTNGGREISLDFAATLSSLIPVIQRAFCTADEIFVFKAMGNGQVRSLNPHESLADQKFQPNDWLILFPLKSLLRNLPVSSVQNIEKEGILIKKSMKKNREQTKKGFLSKDNAPSGAIPLEYYTSSFNIVRQEKDPQAYVPLLDFYHINDANAMQQFEFFHTAIAKVAIILKRHVNCFSDLKEQYVFQVEKSKAAAVDMRHEILKEWFQVINRKCPDKEGSFQVFGVSLNTVFQRSGGGLPLVVTECVSYLDSFGLETEGLFRLSGSLSLIEYYKDQFDQGKEPDLQKCSDPHAVAGLLKLFFRELPEPLLTYNLYEEFIASHAKGIPPTQRVENIKALVKKLPQPNQLLLQYIIAFLARVVRYSEINKMSKSNLGTTFGPNLLRSRDFLDVNRTLQDSGIVNEICQTLIDSAQTLFESVADNIIAHNKSKPSPATRAGRPIPKGLGTKTPTLRGGTLREGKIETGVVKEGMLVKKSLAMRTIETWHERWFRLSPDGLQWFKSNKEKVPLGTIDLLGVTVGNSSERPNCFVLTQPQGTYYLCASSSEELEEWKDAVVRAADQRRRKEGNLSEEELQRKSRIEFLANKAKEEESIEDDSSDTLVFNNTSAPSQPSGGSLPKPNPSSPPQPSGKKLPFGAYSLAKPPQKTSGNPLSRSQGTAPTLNEQTKPPVRGHGSADRDPSKPFPPNPNIRKAAAPPSHPPPSFPSPSSGSVRPPPGRNVNQTKSPVLSTASPSSQPSNVSPRKELPTPPPKEISKKVIAEFDHEAEEADELGFKEGDIITVLKEDPSGWWYGTARGKYGIFPVNYTNGG